MPRRGLGRGLDALIPADEPADETEGLHNVPVDAIVPNPHQPRTTLHEADLEDLANSIREHGLIQPLIVTQHPEGGYQLIAGERRWRAARRADLTEVPVIVKDVAPQQMLELALVENIQRADLNPLEEALAYQHLVEDFGLSQTEIARRVGKSRPAVVNVMRLLGAADAVKEALLREEITEGHGRALLGLPKEAQTSALQVVLQKGLTVRETEALVKRRREAPKETKPQPVVDDSETAQVRALESRFQEALGTRVQLKNTQKGGRVVIYYYSDEEFQALYHRLTGEEL
jgi:ParB family transcriptional regulator, chromosome partitioning protein